jgi:hypothetical protein
MGGMRKPLLATLALTLTLTVAAAGCGGDDDSADTTTTTTTTTTVVSSNPGPVTSASPELCAARDNLRDSISALGSVNVVADGLSAISDALTQIGDDLSAVRSAAGSDVQAQADAFQGALDELQTAISGARGNGASGLSAVGTAVSNVVSTGDTLLTSLGNLNCS